MKVSVAAFTSASRQTEIIFLQTNRARHHVDGLFVTILQIVNDAGIVVAEIQLRLKANDLEKVGAELRRADQDAYEARPRKR